MAIVSALEAQARFEELLERVVSGEVIVITRQDCPVARMVPEHPRNSEGIVSAVESLRKLRARAPAAGLEITDLEVKSARDEGRR